MLFYLLSKLKPSKFNRNVLIFVNIPLGFFLGALIGEISAHRKFVEVRPELGDHILFNFLILICYLYLYRSIKSNDK